MENILTLDGTNTAAMDNTTITFTAPGLLKAAAAFLLGQLLGIPSLVWTLVGFMVIDYMTGIGAAYVKHEICSEEGFIGLIKKMMALLFVMAVHLAEHASGLTLHVNGIEIHLDQAAATLLIFNEIISIIENCAKAGVPIPSVAVSWLQRFKKIYNIRRASLEEIQALKDEKQDARANDEVQ